MSEDKRRAGLAVLALVIAAGLSGCHGGGGGFRRGQRSEPGLVLPDEGAGTLTDPVVIEPAPAQVGLVDRHPLFRKPMEYYNSSGDNVVVKAAAATVVGIPAGVLGEVRQIVVGRPANVR